MLPSHITKWARKYSIDPEFIWEMIEVTSDGLNELTDESMLFDRTVEYLTAMVEGVYEDPTRRQTQTYLLHYLPVIHALAPYLTVPQHAGLIAATGPDTHMMTDAMYIILDTSVR